MGTFSFLYFMSSRSSLLCCARLSFRFKPRRRTRTCARSSGVRAVFVSGGLILWNTISESFLCVFARMIILFSYNALYTGIYYTFGAMITRRHFTVYCSAVNRNAMSCCLDNSVFLCVACSYTMLCLYAVLMYHRFHLMSDFVTVG